MTAVALKVDKNGRTLQSLSPVPASVVNTALDAAAQLIALPTGATVLRMAASGECYLLFGASTVVATSANGMLFPVGAEVITLDPSWTHVSMIRSGTETGVFSIIEMR